MLTGLVSFLGLLPCFVKGGKHFPFSLMLHGSCFPWLNRRAQTGSGDFNVTAGRPQGVTVALVVLRIGSSNGGDSSSSSNALGVGMAGRLECFGCVIRRLTTGYLACSSHVPVVHLCKNVR